MFFFNLNIYQQQFKNSLVWTSFFTWVTTLILLLHTVKKLNHYSKTGYGFFTYLSKYLFFKIQRKYSHWRNHTETHAHTYKYTQLLQTEATSNQGSNMSGTRFPPMKLNTQIHAAARLTLARKKSLDSSLPTGGIKVCFPIKRHTYLSRHSRSQPPPAHINSYYSIALLMGCTPRRPIQLKTQKIK